MHKKIHQNIIFAIHHVKRNRVNPANQVKLQPEALAKIECAAVSAAAAKSTVTLAFNKNKEKKHTEQAQCQMEVDDGIGEATDRELSLSREDDSDLSVIEASSEEEQRRNEAIKKEAEDDVVIVCTSQEPEQQDEEEKVAADVVDASDSESVENSDLEEESEYDEAAQRKEESNKLVKILSKKEMRTATLSTSKVKLPYEMLITKLVDSLETPIMVKEKRLPEPEGFDQEAAEVVDHTFKSKELHGNFDLQKVQQKPNKDVFASAYPTMATQATLIGAQVSEPAPKQIMNVPTATVMQPFMSAPGQMQFLGFPSAPAAGQQPFLQVQAAAPQQQILYQVPTATFGFAAPTQPF